MVNVITIGIDEIISYTFPLNQFLNLIITSEDKKYNFKVYFKDTDKILCLNKNQFNEKIGKDKNSNELTEKFKDYSFLIYDCPVPDFDNLQWTENDYNHLKKINYIIELISKNRSISNSGIFFFGNNENSFFPLIFSVLIRNSRILVENPILNLKENPLFENNLGNMTNDSYCIFKSMNEITDSENSKEPLEKHEENNLNEIKRDLEKLNENHEKLMELFDNNYVLKNELLLEKNKLSVELEKKRGMLLKTQEENETLKLKINERDNDIEMLNNNVRDIFNAESKLRSEVALLKNQNYELKQDLLKKEKENSLLNSEITKIKDDELNRLKLMQKGIYNEEY